MRLTLAHRAVTFTHALVTGFQPLITSTHQISEINVVSCDRQNNKLLFAMEVTYSFARLLCVVTSFSQVVQTQQTWKSTVTQDNLILLSKSFLHLTTPIGIPFPDISV